MEVSGVTGQTDGGEGGREWKSRGSQGLRDRWTEMGKINKRSGVTERSEFLGRTDKIWGGHSSQIWGVRSEVTLQPRRQP